MRMVILCYVHAMCTIMKHLVEFIFKKHNRHVHSYNLYFKEEILTLDLNSNLYKKNEK